MLEVNWISNIFFMRFRGAAVSVPDYESTGLGSNPALGNTRATHPAADPSFVMADI